MKKISGQNGAALVVGMLVLLVMTLLGISSMSTTTTELKMASNNQNRNTGFQAAEAVFLQAWFESAIDWDERDDTLEQAVTVPTVTDLALKGTVTYVDCKQPMIGYGFDAGGTVQEVTATGSLVDANGDVLGTSTQVMGVLKAGVGCSN